MQLELLSRLDSNLLGIYLCDTLLFNILKKKIKEHLHLYFFTFFMYTLLYLIFIYFTFLFLAVLGLHCCMQSFSSCSKQGLLSSYNTWASHCGVFFYCGAQALGLWTSVVPA